MSTKRIFILAGVIVILEVVACKAQIVIVTRDETASDDVAANAEQSGDQAAPSEETELTTLGLTIAPSDDKSGLVVMDIDPDSDAADQVFKGGEKIVSINNRKVTNAADVGNVLDEALASA